MNFLTHPAAVHVPLALAILFPIFYVATLWATTTKRVPHGVWYALFALGVLQIGSTLFAYMSGETSKILSSGSPEQIARHEQFGLYFVILWLVIPAVLIVAARVHQKFSWLVLHALLFALLVAQIGVGIQLGKLGGALVAH